MSRLTLLLPGLLGSFTGMPDEEKPGFPAIESLLARAGRQQISRRSFYSDLCDLCALDKPAGGDLPVAPLGRLIDGAEHPDGIWMRADPVHLAVGRDSVRLHDSASLSMTQHDAIIFAAALEGLFKEYNWKLEVPLPERWYVRLPHKPAITTHEIDYVTGKDIQSFLPSGPESNQWLRLTNEVQMLLHACDINQEREQRGAPAINSLWFWGIGALPGILPRKWTRIYSNDPAAQGLAMLSGTEFLQLPEQFNAAENGFESGDDVLLACATALTGTRHQDINKWLESLEQLEQNWFEPIAVAVNRKLLDELIVISDGYEFIINRYSPLRFWRRRRSVIDYG